MEVNYLIFLVVNVIYVIKMVIYNLLFTTFLLYILLYFLLYFLIINKEKNKIQITITNSILYIIYLYFLFLLWKEIFFKLHLYNRMISSF